MQIDCRATTRAEARELAQAIQTALDGYRGIVTDRRMVIEKISGRSTFEKTDAEVFYTVGADYQVWSAPVFWLLDFSNPLNSMYIGQVV